MYVSVYVCVYVKCVCVWRCSWRPEEAVRAPRAEVTGNCEPPEVMLGTELRFSTRTAGTGPLSHFCSPTPISGDRSLTGAETHQLTEVTGQQAPGDLWLPRPVLELQAHASISGFATCMLGIWTQVSVNSAGWAISLVPFKFISSYDCVCESKRPCATVCVWRTEDNFWQ